MQLIAGLRERMFRPVDISGLVVFRVLFGLLMAWDTARYVTFGWVSAHYVKPPILLKYIGFQWVAPLPEPLMYGVFGMMIASGIAIALGWYYRLSCAIFCLGHTYAFLLAASYYLNHAYLISVWAALMIFVPAHRTASIDALRAPEIQTRQVHDWYRWLLIGTLTVVYIFGAIAKMNVDWFAGMPTRMWMAHSASEVPIGGDVLRSEFFLWAVTYGGLLYDLFIVPALLWKRTRVIAVILSCGFHLTNAYMFNIGVFPWFMLAATTLFFVPAWPRKLPRKLIGPLLELVDYRLDDDGDQANQRKRKRKKSKQKKAPLGPPALTNRQRTRTLALVSGFLLIMCLIPLRHHLYPGHVAWTEEGHYLSWRMKLRDKRGRLEFIVTSPETQQRWVVHPNEQLHARQTRKIISKPDLILQYAHYLRDAYKRDYGLDVEVRVNSFVSLNYRKEQRFIDPTVDLAKEEFSLWPYDWILPMEDAPLPPPVSPLKSSLGSVAQKLARAMASQARL